MGVGHFRFLIFDFRLGLTPVPSLRRAGNRKSKIENV